MIESSRQPWSARDLAIIVAIVLVVTIVYARVSTFAFVNYDDDQYVYENPFVSAGLTAKGLVQALASGHAANWHPLTWLSHMLDVSLFGLQPGSHHVVNVALHSANALLLFLALRSLTGARWRSAFVVALFALHPLNVDTVAWIAERKSLLSTLFWILAIMAYARSVETRRGRDWLLLYVFFVAGLMCKPMIVTLPATLLIVDVWPLGRLRLDELAHGEGRTTAWSLVNEKLPLFALSAICAVVTFGVQAASNAVTSHEAIPIGQRLLNVPVSLGWYLAKTIVPTDLCVHYPHPSILGGRVPAAVAAVSLVVFAMLAAAAYAARRRNPYLLAGLAWYAVTLLPVLGIIQVGVQSHADRYAYIPLIGIFIAITWLVSDEAERLRVDAHAAGAACIVLAVMSLASYRQVGYWRESSSLWTHALVVTEGNNPTARRNLASHHTSLGKRKKESGDLTGALADFRAAVALEQSETTLYNEAAILSDLNRHAEAIPLYRMALELEPAHADAWLNLGDALVITGKLTEARDSYYRTLRLRRDKFADYGLAYVSTKTGDVATAAAALARLEREDPELALDLRRMLAR